MAQYLSDEWFSEMETAAASYSPDESRPVAVSLREIVTEGPNGTVSYVMTIADGKVSFSRSEDARADVTFTQSYDTAVALHKGELTIHDAFFAGRIRIAGHLNTLLDHADLLQGLAPAFDPIRSSTTY